jgi:hypothetical protein
MKKTVRITESDLTRLVNKILVEEDVFGSIDNTSSNNTSSNNTSSNNISPEQQSQIKQIITNETKKVKNYYQQHYSKPETVAKFKDKNNINDIKTYIKTIKCKLIIEYGNRFGFVNKDKPSIINLIVNNLFVRQGDNMASRGNLVYDTILHEMAHLIDFRMKKLGEKPITASSGYYSPNSGENKDDYVQSNIETFARIQRLREILGLNPNANGYDIKEKLIEFIKSKKLTLPNVEKYGGNSPNGIFFTLPQRRKGTLTDLWGFYSPMKINGTSVPDIAALFGKYSSLHKSGFVFLNLDTIGKVNVSTVSLPNPDSMAGYA